MAYILNTHQPGFKLFLNSDHLVTGSVSNGMYRIPYSLKTPANSVGLLSIEQCILRHPTLLS